MNIEQQSANPSNNPIIHLHAELKTRLIEELALVAGRPVDLIDLNDLNSACGSHLSNHPVIQSDNPLTTHPSIQLSVGGLLA